MTKRSARLLLCLTIAALAVPLLAQSQWKLYSFPADGFAVSAPTEPVFSKQNKATAIGNVEMHVYSVPLGKTGLVMISSSPIPKDNTPVKVRLQNAKEGALQAGKAKLTSEKDIVLGTVPGIQFEAASDQFHVRARVFIVKDKLIQLLEMAPLSAPIPADADRISNSFKLVSAAK